jgi:type I restriction enzyme S subunit
MESSAWRVCTLGDLIESGSAALQTGPFGTALKASEYTEHGVPVISVGEIREGYFDVSKDTPRVGAKTIERLPRFVLRTGDIVFGRKGGVERNALVGNR